MRNSNVSDEISLVQFHKLIIISFYYAVSDNRSILTSFHILLLEHLILCRLVMGQKGQAIREVATAAQLCAAGPPRLLAAHSAQLHTLLGLYAMSMNSMDAAEAQLNVALRVDGGQSYRECRRILTEPLIH